MPFPPPYHPRRLDAGDLEAVLELDAWAFPSPHTVDETRDLAFPLEWDRTVGVTRSEDPESAASPELAAMFSAYPLRGFPVPGAEVACGFLTWVGVHPGHRRRGLLRGMIETHFSENLARGEAVSALFASEPEIYGRFGYGAAAAEVSLVLDRAAALRPVAGSELLRTEIVTWDAARHGEAVSEIHAAYARRPEGLGRPGWATWETPAMRAAREADPALLREGVEPRRLLLVRDASGAPLAYAGFRRRTREERTGHANVVEVRDAVALTPASSHRLWSALLDLDLTRTIEVQHLPTDDPLLSLLVDVRRARVNLQDNLWVRILDLPAALSQRRYAADVDVVIEVDDAMLPANSGRWRVRARAWEPARVERSSAEPELRMGIRELGAAHLGSTSLAGLAQAGLLESRSHGALASASAAWSWPVAAGANWIF